MEHDHRLALRFPVLDNGWPGVLGKLERKLSLYEADNNTTNTTNDIITSFALSSYTDV